MESVTSTPLAIVLVEDNPDDEELMLEALKAYRLRNPIVVLRDGQQAIDYFFREGDYTDRSLKQPDLILLDIKLPKIDGLDVLAKIKSDDELKRIPVVVLTSSKEDRDIARGYELGANSYIVKPIDFEQLIETVRTIGGYWLIVNEPAPNK